MGKVLDFPKEKTVNNLGKAHEIVFEEFVGVVFLVKNAMDLLEEIGINATVSDGTIEDKKGNTIGVFRTLNFLLNEFTISVYLDNLDEVVYDVKISNSDDEVFAYRPKCEGGLVCSILQAVGMVWQVNN